MFPRVKLHSILLWVVFLLVAYVPGSWANFVTFESGQVRPLTMSPDGSRLFAVNTPDNSLEVFEIKSDGLVHISTVPVGLEPVAVAAKNDSEVWVVNHLSDSVSIVDVSGVVPRVRETLLVGDEPRDIVFAGVDSGLRAFITTAHRGQNSPYGPAFMPNNPGEITTPGIGRADVWVFNANSSSTSPLTILSHFTDTPRALAVSPDKGTVYVAGFHTGNQTTAINEGAVCDGWQVPLLNTCFSAPGGLPLPNQNLVGVQAPEVGLIVKFNGLAWVDELNRDWSNQVMFNLPDKDVFAIDANAATPVEIDDYSGVGTILYNMVANPATGQVYVSNTEANNHVRFEGTRHSTSHSSVIGHQHETRITIINPEPGGAIIPRHLNKHINYDVVPTPVGIKDNSLAIPTDMAITDDGSTLYLAAFGSSKVGVFNTVELENNSFVPSSANYIPVSGGGASGLVLDESNNRLYVLTRFDNSISVVDIVSKTEILHRALHNPEPPHVVAGRPFLYDANLTSSNGEASCGSCHVFGDFDSLAWDLGDPEGEVINNNNLPGPTGGLSDFHPMKGPMTTQSLRGLIGQGPLHWRGDRSASNVTGVQADSMDSAGAFREFNVAFVGLLGRDTQLTIEEMNAFTNFMMEVTYPPNPNRPLDNSKTPSQQRGSDFFFNASSTAGLTCNACHVVDPPAGFFGSNGLMSFEAETQDFKIAHLRNMYQKVGMFGMPQALGIVPGDNIHMGDQIRGFGFIHDGSVDNLFRFHSSPLFAFPNGDPERRDVEQFMHAMDTNLAPVVGQQVTLNSTNETSVSGKISLFEQQANAGESDLVVKGAIAGEPRSWHRLSNGTYQSDKSSEAAITSTQLSDFANTIGQELTYMAVPPGSGVRIGIDRDNDGVHNRDDNCPMKSNPLQEDGDSDGIGDACDLCINHANTNQNDSNGDGFGNRCDADFNNDTIVNAADIGLLRQKLFSTDADGDINGDGVVNAIDIGMFRQLLFNPPGPSGL